MSKMCKMNNSCTAKPSMCVHEKMLLLAMVLIVVAGIAAYRFFA